MWRWCANAYVSTNLHITIPGHDISPLSFIEEFYVERTLFGAFQLTMEPMTTEHPDQAKEKGRFSVR